MTGWTVATIQKKAREGALPSRKLGRLTRFVPAEIEQWLAELPRPS
jgi:excisionase family DNA binding protein